MYPAAASVSVYLSNPMDCSHSHTDHTGVHTSGTTDTHTSEPSPDSKMAAVGLQMLKGTEVDAGDTKIGVQGTLSEYCRQYHSIYLNVYS